MLLVVAISWSSGIFNFYLMLHDFLTLSDKNLDVIHENASNIKCETFIHNSYNTHLPFQSSIFGANGQLIWVVASGYSLISWWKFFFLLFIVISKETTTFFSTIDLVSSKASYKLFLLCFSSQVRTFILCYWVV